MKFEPSYLRVYESGELKQRVERALELLKCCTACPRDCQVNRFENQRAFCLVGRYAIVSSYFPHFGEEDCLRGSHGSGTIFFSRCNLRCVFCQNFDISWLGQGREVTAQELAQMMLELQAQGCHNINFVTPEHVVPQIVEALPYAIEGGLRLPLVYNTSAYDSMESLQLMDGIIDIYMPDFKFWDPVMAKRYVKAENYPETAKRALKEMYRQVGDLVIDESGIAQRGLLIRHLIMPRDVAGTREILRFIAQELSPNSYVNLMAQYRPAGKAPRYPEINRRITAEEYRAAYRAAEEAGLHRLDERWAER